MNLYLISQNVNSGYDTFDAAVVAAPNEIAARRMHPGGNGRLDTWCDMRHVKAEYLGETERPQGVILASFNAG